MSQTNEIQRDTMMPFVLCRANGGPYDDDAFMSGWRLGDIDATLGGPGVSAFATSIHPRERDQAELIGLAHGYSMIAGPGGDPEWISVTFSRMDDF